MENLDQNRFVLRCPSCSAPLTIIGKRSGEAYCSYCRKKHYYYQQPDGTVAYTDRKGLMPGAHGGRGIAVFWGVAAVIAAVFIGAVFFSAGDGNGKKKEVTKSHRKYLEKISTDTYRWPATALGDVVPEAVFANGSMMSSSEESFLLQIGNVSRQEYEAYTVQCMEAGFSENIDQSGRYLHAFNGQGYELQVSYDEEDQCMQISAHAPALKTEYVWPEAGLASLLPKPASSYGEIEEGNQVFKAKIYGTSGREFEHYVDECVKAGFNRDYDKAIETGYFRGYDENGYELYIRYEENDYNQTMEITLDHP